MGVGSGVGTDVGSGVGTSVGTGVGSAVGTGVGEAVGDALGDGLGDALTVGLGDGVTGSPLMWSEPPLQVPGTLSCEYQPVAMSVQPEPGRLPLLRQ